MSNPIQQKSEKELALTNAKIDRKLLYNSLYDHLTAVVEKKVFIDGEEKTVTEPNYPVQEKAQEKLLRVTGDIKPDAQSTSGNTLVINVSKEDVVGLLNMVTAVNRELESLKSNGRQTGFVNKSEAVDASYS